METDNSYDNFKQKYKGKLLEPCKQWICDICHELIESPDDGELQYFEDVETKECFGFLLVHFNHEEVEQYPNGQDVSYVSRFLSGLQGEEGMQRYLSIQQYETIKDYTEYLMTFRRLFVPYFEQASIYFQQALENNFFEGNNIDEPYLSESLKLLVEHSYDYK